jgi:hypothetical protein
MKKIFLTIAIFLIFSGIVSASSMNGNFNGDPIVKVKSYGTELTVTDVPAIVYKGRTMVPVYLLKQLGASVDWNGDTYTVDVKLSSQVNSPDLNVLKEYTELLDYYSGLERFGDKFYQVQTSLVLNLAYLKPGTNQDTNLKDASDKLNRLINDYNSLQKDESIIKLNASKYGIVDNSIDTILVNYNKGIEYFKTAVDALYTYNNNTNLENDFFNPLKLAAPFIVNGINDSYSGYEKYFKLIQGY